MTSQMLPAIWFARTATMPISSSSHSTLVFTPLMSINKNEIPSRILQNPRYAFINQLGYDFKWLKNVFLPKIKSTLKDNILQKWQNDVDASNKCFYYKHFQPRPMMQKYLLTLPQNAWIPILKFRTSNHRLPIEIYSWKVAFVDRYRRLCTMCNTNEVGDEYHYLIVCPIFHEARIQFIPKYFRVRPSVFKFLELINSNDKKTLVKLSKFIKIIFSVFK